MKDKRRITTVLQVAAVWVLGLLAANILLADPAGDYELLFGEEAIRVTATSDTADDAVFARKLLRAAGDVPDSPAFQILLYDKTYEFALRDASGYSDALEAVKSLEKAVPSRRSDLQRMKFRVLQLRYTQSSDPVKRLAARPYLEMLIEVADAKVSADKVEEAKGLYREASEVARYLESPKAAEIQAKLRRVSDLLEQKERLKKLQDKLALNPKDIETRQKLILLYVAELDKPLKAKKLLNSDVDEAFRTYVPLAAKELESIDKNVLVELGNWYYKRLAREAGPLSKFKMLSRAKACYERFIAVHKKRDVRTLQAKLALRELEKDLTNVDDLESAEDEVDIPRWIASPRTACPYCNGTGLMPCTVCRVKDVSTGKQVCPQCHGKGHTACSTCGGNREAKCTSCGGKGKIRKGSRFEGRFKIPIYEPCKRCDSTGWTVHILVGKAWKRIPGRCPRCGNRPSALKGTVECAKCQGEGTLGACPVCKGTKRIPCIYCDAGLREKVRREEIEGTTRREAPKKK
ncbi:MAG: hypothetical protein QF577_06210 [Phycisphaerae bacterium]|jgi:hypothetical protein|nr:hypothetical protein [Phycisphaerae bacterium]